MEVSGAGGVQTTMQVYGLKKSMELQKEQMSLLLDNLPKPQPVQNNPANLGQHIDVFA